MSTSTWRPRSAVQSVAVTSTSTTLRSSTKKRSCPPTPGCGPTTSHSAAVADARHGCGPPPDQTSDALGAAGFMLGPRVKALASWIHVELDVAMSKTAQVLDRLGELTVTAGGLHRALHGVADDAESTYRTDQHRAVL